LVFLLFSIAYWSTAESIVRKWPQAGDDCDNNYDLSESKSFLVSGWVFIILEIMFFAALPLYRRSI